MTAEWRKRKGDWRHHFKEKMSQEQTHHHRMMQSYPPRALDRRLQEHWARVDKEDPRVLISLSVDF